MVGVVLGILVDVGAVLLDRDQHADAAAEAGVAAAEARNGRGDALAAGGGGGKRDAVGFEVRVLDVCIVDAGRDVHRHRDAQRHGAAARGFLNARYEFGFDEDGRSRHDISGEGDVLHERGRAGACSSDVARGVTGGDADLHAASLDLEAGVGGQLDVERLAGIDRRSGRGDRAVGGSLHVEREALFAEAWRVVVANSFDREDERVGGQVDVRRISAATGGDDGRDLEGPLAGVRGARCAERGGNCASRLLVLGSLRVLNPVHEELLDFLRGVCSGDDDGVARGSTRLGNLDLRRRRRLRCRRRLRRRVYVGRIDFDLVELAIQHEPDRDARRVGRDGRRRGLAGLGIRGRGLGALRDVRGFEQRRGDDEGVGRHRGGLARLGVFDFLGGGDDFDLGLLVFPGRDGNASCIGRGDLLVRGIGGDVAVEQLEGVGIALAALAGDRDRHGVAGADVAGRDFGRGRGRATRRGRGGLGLDRHELATDGERSAASGDVFSAPTGARGGSHRNLRLAARDDHARDGVRVGGKGRDLCGRAHSLDQRTARVDDDRIVLALHEAGKRSQVEGVVAIVIGDELEVREARYGVALLERGRRRHVRRGAVLIPLRRGLGEGGLEIGVVAQEGPGHTSVGGVAQRQPGADALGRGVDRGGVDLVARVGGQLEGVGRARATAGDLGHGAVGGRSDDDDVAHEVTVVVLDDVIGLGAGGVLVHRIDHAAVGLGLALELEVGERDIVRCLEYIAGVLGVDGAGRRLRFDHVVILVGRAVLLVEDVLHAVNDLAVFRARELRERNARIGGGEDFAIPRLVNPVGGGSFLGDVVGRLPTARALGVDGVNGAVLDHGVVDAVLEGEIVKGDARGFREAAVGALGVDLACVARGGRLPADDDAGAVERDLDGRALLDEERAQVGRVGLVGVVIGGIHGRRRAILGDIGDGNPVGRVLNVALGVNRELVDALGFVGGVSGHSLELGVIGIDDLDEVLDERLLGGRRRRGGARAGGGLLIIARRDGRTVGAHDGALRRFRRHLGVAAHDDVARGLDESLVVVDVHAKRQRTGRLRLGRRLAGRGLAGNDRQRGGALLSEARVYDDDPVGCRIGQAVRDQENILPRLVLRDGDDDGRGGRRLDVVLGAVDEERGEQENVLIGIVVGAGAGAGVVDLAEIGPVAIARYLDVGGVRAGAALVVVILTRFENPRRVHGDHVEPLFVELVVLFVRLRGGIRGLLEGVLVGGGQAPVDQLVGARRMRGDDDFLARIDLGVGLCYGTGDDVVLAILKVLLGRAVHRGIRVGIAGGAGAGAGVVGLGSLDDLVSRLRIARNAHEVGGVLLRRRHGVGARALNDCVGVVRVGAGAGVVVDAGFECRAAPGDIGVGVFDLDGRCIVCSRLFRLARGGIPIGGAVGGIV